jgi:glycosyltransferase involved in cell wall biosynthesis
MPRKLSVVIPSRTQAQQMAFLEKAIASIRTQTIATEFSLHILVCVDQGARTT